MMSTPNSFAHEQLRQLSSHITLVVLHPDYHAQHTLLSAILADPSLLTVYLPIAQPELPLNEFRLELAQALQSQLSVRVAALPEGPAEAGEAVAATLNSRGQVALVLDAFDRIPLQYGLPFAAALASHLQSGNRLILSTRILPIALFDHPDLAHRIALVPVHPDRMILNYAERTDKPILEVRALGPGRVLIDGRSIDEWDGILPRTLFFYFIDRGMTTRDEIFQTFWPTLTTREATNVFHVTKRKISEILQADLTVYWSGFYRISPALDLQYDVIKFAEAVQNAAVAPDDEAIQLYQNAIALYHGNFLSSIQQPWVERRRLELVTSYAEALAGLGRIHLKRQAPLEALGYYLRACATSPHREDLARAVMELFRDLGQPSDALATFARLQDALRTTLGVRPDRQTVELADAIRATVVRPR